jgi:signal peptidase II
VIYGLIIPCIILLDQFIKRAVTLRLQGAGGPSPHLVPGLFDLVYVENTGAVFSLLQGKRVFLILFAALMIAAIVVYVFLHRKSIRPLALAGLSLVVGGGLGNLIDRVRLGYVVDYIEFQPFSFPVFNFADISICTGCGLLLLYVAAAEFRAREGKTLDGPAE